MRARTDRKTVVTSALTAVPSTLTRADAIRFLQRATFGARPGDDVALMAQGLDAWFDDQFARMPGETMFERRHKTDPYSSFYDGYWRNTLTAPDALRKRVATALSQILVVGDNGARSSAVAAYADMLEVRAFGTYRNLLEEVTRSHAMGDYLTYMNNKKADPRRGRVPDENYAREVMQLFSIGLWELNSNGTRRQQAGVDIATYDNDDILGLARVFTGWRAADQNTSPEPEYYRAPMEMREGDHEPGTKAFLGVEIPENTLGDDSLTIALDTLATHPNVGPFIGRQLIQRLVTSNPSPAYVGRVSAVFDNDGTGQRGNLGAVVKTILTDDEAWQADPPQSFGKLREPALRFTVVTRALGISDDTDDDWPFNSLSDSSDELGQQPYDAPSVFNFYRPGYVPPQTQLADAGLTAPEFQIANESSSIGWINFLSRWLRSPYGDIVYDIADLEALVDDVPALVTEVAARLCPSGISSALRSIIERRIAAIEHRDAARQTRERVMGTALLIAASTDFLYER